MQQHALNFLHVRSAAKDFYAVVAEIGLKVLIYPQIEFATFSVIAICAFHCEGLRMLRQKVEQAGGLTGVGLLLCSKLKKLPLSSCYQQ